MGAFDFVKIFRVNKSISIDLGTANILIYDKQRKKIVLNEPSVVARDRKTGKLIAVLYLCSLIKFIILCSNIY